MSRPYYEDEFVTLYCGRCEDVLSDLPVADLLLTDPPYGIGIASKDLGAGRSTGIASTKMAYGDWDSGRIPANVMFLVLASAKNAIIWGGNYYADLLAPSQGWLVWDKRGDLPQRSFADAEMAWTSFDRATRVWTHRWDGFIRDDAETRNGHPTQKPLGLMQWCLGLCPAGSVIDPFAGSGTTLVAAKRLNRQCVGIERDERYCAVAAERLSQCVLDLGGAA